MRSMTSPVRMGGGPWGVMMIRLLLLLLWLWLIRMLRSLSRHTLLKLLLLLLLLLLLMFLDHIVGVCFGNFRSFGGRSSTSVRRLRNRCQGQGSSRGLVGVRITNSGGGRAGRMVLSTRLLRAALVWRWRPHWISPTTSTSGLSRSGNHCWLGATGVVWNALIRSGLHSSSHMGGSCWFGTSAC